MLDTLKFVRGAVAAKDFVPALTHFQIANGFIKGYNGSIGLCSPIELDLDVKPRAAQFIKAIQTCKSTVQLSLTTNGRLSIKSGAFKAFINCIEEDFPDIKPSGEVVQLDGKLLRAIKVLNKFIAEDASRPWARGILFRGPSAFATNNIVILEYWLGYNFPIEVNIPKAAIQEMVRINEEPTHLQMDETSVTFHYSGDRWLKTQIYTTEWPDLSKALGRECNPTPLPEGFFEALESLVPFVDEFSSLYLSNNKLSTGTIEESGFSVEVPGIVSESRFNIKHMQLLDGVAKLIDLTLHPSPCLFFGDNVRGAIVGMREVVALK